MTRGHGRPAVAGVAQVLYHRYPDAETRKRFPPAQLVIARVSRSIAMLAMLAMFALVRLALRLFARSVAVRGGQFAADR